jgi:hypothetical protein
MNRRQSQHREYLHQQMNQCHWLAVVYVRCNQIVQRLFLLQEYKYNNNVKQVTQITNPADIIPTNMSRHERNTVFLHM